MSCLCMCYLVASTLHPADSSHATDWLLSVSLSLTYLYFRMKGHNTLFPQVQYKVQRLLALLHIMKEGWSLDPAGNWPRDWVTKEKEPGGDFFFFSFLSSSSFTSQMPLFFLFCFGAWRRGLFAETNFLLLFFRQDGDVYRHIMLKACILTQLYIDTHIHTNRSTNAHPHTHIHLQTGHL